MKARKKIWTLVASVVILLVFLVYMSQFRYPCVKKGISMSEARHIADTRPGYFIITQMSGCTSAPFMIAYGEHEGTPVELAGCDPMSDLGWVFFWAKPNYCLVHGVERNKENIGTDYYQYESADIELMYTIDVADWEIIMPIRRFYEYENYGRLLYPFWCIDTFDVEHGVYAAGHNNEEVLYPDILHSLTPLSGQEDATVRGLYQEQLQEWSALGAAYEVYYGRFDLNGDGADEIVSYAISAMNSGSLGNIQLDIWKEKDGSYTNIGLEDALLLNPHETGFEDLRADIMLERQNGHCLIRITSEYSGGDKTRTAVYSYGRYQFKDGT